MFFRVSFVNLDQQHCFLLQTLLHATALLFVVFLWHLGCFDRCGMWKKIQRAPLGRPLYYSVGNGCLLPL